jgi:class 3 adenylate cyclase
MLATVLFSDIVGSTQAASRLGDRRWRALLDAHYAVVRAELDRFGGREIDTAGDGLFAAFAGPARAISCACAMRDAVRTLGLEIRIGLHTGEVETAGEHLAGIAVHIGARVAAAAQPSEVLVSRTVADLVAGSGIPAQRRPRRLAAIRRRQMTGPACQAGPSQRVSSAARRIRRSARRVGVDFISALSRITGQSGREFRAIGLARFLLAIRV